MINNKDKQEIKYKLSLDFMDKYCWTFIFNIINIYCWTEKVFTKHAP